MASYELTDEEFRVIMRSFEDNQKRLRKARAKFEYEDRFRDLEEVSDKLRRILAVVKSLNDQYWAQHAPTERAG
jgi:molecular chaperone GrpE (heat shock protein)